ncbi:MAG TPA: hypothetical protein PK644_11485, partial [bacterium]|nr:hypothetical protein [bacterium]
MDYDPVIRFCWVVISLSVVFLSGYTVFTLRRVNRILKDLESLTSKVRPAVEFMARSARVLGGVLS